MYTHVIYARIPLGSENSSGEECWTCDWNIVGWNPGRSSWIFKIIFWIIFLLFFINPFLCRWTYIHLYVYTKHTHKYKVNVNRLTLLASLGNGVEEAKKKNISENKKTQQQKAKKPENKQRRKSTTKWVMRECRKGRGNGTVTHLESHAMSTASLPESGELRKSEPEQQQQRTELGSCAKIEVDVLGFRP